MNRLASNKSIEQGVTPHFIQGRTLLNFKDIRQRSLIISEQSVEFDDKGPKVISPQWKDDPDGRVLASFTMTKNLYSKRGFSDLMAGDFAEAVVRERYKV